MVDLSLVIPCFDEEDTFAESMQRITGYLDSLGIDYEIILVEDKSRDNTRELIKELVKRKRRVSAIFHEKNLGKGRTVTDGFRKARGQVVGFIDMDLEVSEQYIQEHIQAIQSGYGVTYADRKTALEFAIIPRLILHEIYNLLTRLLLRVPPWDMNSGYKFFNRRKILPILDKVEDRGFFWDTEVLFHSYKKGLRIKAIPAVYKRNVKKLSTVNVFPDSFYFFKKLLEFRKRVV